MFDLLPSIFSQLPVDTILQCKCVCKTWRTLINELLKDSSFIDTHTRRFLSSSVPSPAAASSYSFLARKKIHIGDANDIDDWNIVGSCNGLVCLVPNLKSLRRLDVCICNPVTREHVNLLPQYIGCSGNKFKMMIGFFIVATGFGYVPCTKEYKFVRITDDRLKIYVSVYTLGSGTWRMIKDDNSFNRLPWDNKSKTASAAGLLFNGALYWSLTLQAGIQILSFDLEKEEFRLVPAPPRSPREYQYVDEIGVLGECFCVIKSERGSSYGSKEIWVMNKEEENYTWTNKLRILGFLAMVPNSITPFPPEEKIFLNYDYMKFASYDHPRTRNCDLGYDDIHLINNNTMSFQMVDWFEILLHMSGFKMIPYTRSLVSLKVLGEKDADVASARKRKRVHNPYIDELERLESIAGCTRFRINSH